MAEMRSDSPAAARTAAREAALLVDETSRGRLRLTGKSGLDFLHRITTNDIRSLEPGGVVASLLVTPKGRLIERLTVLRRSDDLLVLTSAGGREVARDAIRKYIVIEDVEVHDDTHGTFQLGLFGPAAGAVLTTAVGEEPGAESTTAAAGDESRAMPATETARETPASARSVVLAGVEVTVLPEPGPSLQITGAAGDRDRVHATLMDAGRRHGLLETDGAGREIARIELGLPRLGHELIDDLNPLEARQEDALSFDKGCYIGQEVVARLRTYDKVQRELVRLLVEGEEPVEVGASIGAGPQAGRVTSAVALPGEGRTLALGVVARQARGDEAVAVHTAAGERQGWVQGEPVTARDVRVVAPQGLAPGRKRFGS